MASSNQGGSILSFLIIGGVLTALLIGGAYFVQQRSAQPATDKAPTATQPAAQSDDAADKKDTPATDDKKVAVEPNKEEPKKEAPTATPQPATPPTAQLPQTGPAESLLGAVAVGSLAFASLSYIQSRRVRA